MTPDSTAAWSPEGWVSGGLRAAGSGDSSRAEEADASSQPTADA
jgi:hypothetical protein